MKMRVLAALAGAALIAPGAAHAKGPDRATITGPGLDHKAVVLSGFGEDGNGPMGALTMAGGFFPEVFGQVPDPRLHGRPTAVGPRYSVLYRVPGPAIPGRIRQELYPYAKGGPVTYMPRGQSFWGGQKTVGGWIRGPASLRSVLVRAGLPARAPSDGSGSAWTTVGWVAGATAALLAAAGAAALGLRRRPRPLPST